MQTTGGLTFTGGFQVIAPASTSDQYFANVQLLMPMTGANNSTTFTDVSSFSRTVTPLGGTIISTRQSKWGGSSVYFDGVDDRLTIPYNANLLQWYNADFTVEYWIYVVNMSTMFTGHSGPGIPAALGHGTNVDTVDWSFGPTTSGTIRFYYYDKATFNQRSVTSTATITANTWNHIAMTRTSSGINVYVNGISNGTPTAIIGTPDHHTSDNFRIGRLYNRTVNAYIDDVRITRGVARYSGNFSVPTAAFPTS